MKKSRIFLLLMCFLLVFPCVAMAAPPSYLGLKSVMALAFDEDVATKGFTKTQTLYRDVTYHYLDAQGVEVNSQTLYVPTVEATYRYILIKGRSTKRLLGGYVESEPRLKVVGNSIYGISKEEGDPLAVSDVEISDFGQAYYMYARGGYFTVTYNSDLYFDQYGNIIEEKTKSISTPIGYNYSYSGTIADFP